jgi:archaellum component FlaC
VAEVYPDLVVKNKDGQIETVQYQKLTPLLLNEVQKQQTEVQKLHSELDQQHLEAEKQNQHAQQQDETIRQLQARLAALEALLPGKVAASATAGQ